MEIIIFILLITALIFCWQSLKACVEAWLPKESWKELFKIGVIITLIIYIYGKQ
jgi:succinate dehydrogenase hydrophobic anchor subunit